MASSRVSRGVAAGMLVCFSLLLKGCTLTLLFISSIVEDGDAVTVVLEGDPDGQGGGASPQFLKAHVPESWNLASATFSGTSNGDRIYGSGEVIPNPPSCDGCLCGPPAGYQELRIAPEAGIFPFNGTDQVTMTLRFVTAGAGSQQVYFKLCLNNSSNVIEASVDVLPAGTGLVFADNFESGTIAPWSVHLAIDNGGFESGDAFWNPDSIQGIDPIVGPGATPVTPYAGDWLAQLGTVDSEVTYIVHEYLQLPVSPYRVKYRRWVQSTEVECNHDYFAIDFNGIPGVVLPLCAATETGGWEESEADLSPWAGQWVLIGLGGYTDASVPSSAYVDQLELTNTP